MIYGDDFLQLSGTSSVLNSVSKIIEIGLERIPASSFSTLEGFHWVPQTTKGSFSK